VLLLREIEDVHNNSDKNDNRPTLKNMN